MKRLSLIIIVSIFGLINPANAQSLNEHVVQKGETPSSIAEVKHKESNVPMQDVVYLKNGAIIKGVLLSNNTSDIMIQTRDGSVFVYKPEEIERCEQEAMTHTLEGNRRILDIDKTTLGLRTGVIINQSILCDYWDYEYWENKFSPGFHIGASYEYSFTKTNRWFLQTGLDLQYMNARSTGSNYHEWIYRECFDDVIHVKTTNALYLEIPAMISCKFKLNDNLIFYPNIGVAYSIGLVGKYNEKVSNKEYGLLRNTSENCFYKEFGWYETDSDGDEYYETDNVSIYDRHNLALKFGLNLTYNRLYFGGGVFYHVSSGMTWGFNISVGYNF